MNEQYIIDKLILHGIHYNKFGKQEDKRLFAFWMNKLQEVKGFETVNEAIDYFFACEGEPVAA